MGVNSSAFSLGVKSAEFFFYHKLVVFPESVKRLRLP